MDTITKVSRRDFLKVSGAAGTGLVLGFNVPFGRDGFAADASSEAFMPNVWLRVDPDGMVTFWVHRSPLGQGVRTALPMILADELEADWSKIQLQQGDADQEGVLQAPDQSASLWRGAILLASGHDPDAFPGGHGSR